MTVIGSPSAGPPLDLLSTAAQQVTRTVDGFHGDDWRAPSLLPAWSRAHVVAHLALNAEAMARVVHGFLSDEPAAMYDSDERRDLDIDELAAAHHFEIRDRLLGATTVLHDAFTTIPVSVWNGDERVDRTPGGRSMRVASLPGMRLRELEIHHVDLGAGYATSDWSDQFAELLLDAMARVEPPERLELRPLDVDRTWILGADRPGADPGAVVTGPAADLAWWLTGRPAPPTLSCTRGDLPQIGAW